MEGDDFAEEKERIYKAAEVNGYEKKFVDKILQKHKRKRHRQDITTLQPEREEVKRVSLPFYPKLTNQLKSILKQQGLQVVHKSDNTLRDLLCNLKDKVPPDENSGIYRIPCQDCPSVYIGQTKRKAKVRLKEHKTAVDNGKSCDSSVAAHAISLNHVIDWKEAKLIKNIRKPSHLNAWESHHISNSEKPLMNEDDPPITSCLFGLTKLRVQ